MWLDIIILSLVEPVMLNLQVEKNVFVIFYSGERAKNKIVKICEAFRANRYPVADGVAKQYQMIQEVCLIAFVGSFACLL